MEENVKERIIRGIGIIIIIVLFLLFFNSNSKYNEMKNEVDGYKYQISHLKKTNKEYEGLIDSYKKSQIEDKETISKQQTTITELESQVTSLKSKNNELNNEVLTLISEKNVLDKKVVQLTQEVTTKKETINTLTATNTANTKKIAELTSTNNNQSSKINKLETRLETINTYHMVYSEVELIQALKTGGNIILNTDILMTNTIVIEDKYVSIDLRGHNLLVTSIELNNTSLEIKDSMNLGKVSITGENDDLAKGIKVKDSSVLKITNGNYEGKNLIQVTDNQTLYVVGGSFANTQEEIINKTENSKVEILGGTFKTE